MGNFQRPFPLKVPYFSYRAVTLQLSLPPQGSLNKLESVRADFLASLLEQQCVAAMWRHAAVAKGVMSCRTALSLLCQWLTWTTNTSFLPLTTKDPTPTYKHQG